MSRASKCSKFQSNLVIILSVMVLSACAAQSTYREYYEAKEVFERAKSLDPQHPLVQRAELRLESGNRNLKEARFGRASDDFDEVTRLSSKILMSQTAETQEAPPSLQMSAPSRSPQVASASSSSVSQEQMPTARESSQESEAVDQSRMSLPEQALAAYLARKQQPSAKRAPAPKPAPPQPPVDKGQAAQVELRDNEESSQVESGGLVDEKRTVVASAEPQTQLAPNRQVSVEREATNVALNQQLAAPIEEPAAPILDGDDFAEPKSFEPPRRKYPKDLLFQESDVSLRTSEMDKLDEIGQYLINNPSNSLILAGFSTEAESASLIDQRFQAVRAYLNTRGVPEDQVKLDPPRKVGGQPVFEMYLIDH